MPRLRVLVFIHLVRDFAQASSRAADDGREHLQLAHQSGHRGWWRGLGLALGPEKNLRMIEKAFARGCRAAAPGGIELAGFTRAPALASEGGRHPLAVIDAGARHRHEDLHGHVRRDLSLAHLLLDRLRQHFDQRQPPRDPTHIAIEPPRQLIDLVAEAFFELGQQPSLLERCLMLAQTERAIQHQRLALAHRPDHRRHRVAAELLEGCDSLVSVDDQVAIRLTGHRHHHDRRLLAHLGQRRQQPALALGTPNPQVPQAAVKLVKLHVHGRSWCSGPYLGLHGGRRKWDRNSRRINEIRAVLGLRGVEEESRHYPNEISALHAELGLREIPG